MQAWKQGLGAAILLTAGVLGARALIATRPVVEPEQAPRFVPTVRVVRAAPESFVPTIRARGAVRPAEVTRLAAEVSGVVAEVSSHLIQGGFVEEGQVLLRLDPTDFELAAVRAEAALEQAKSALATEVAQAAASLSAWDGDPASAPALVRREPQLAAARANVAAAKADVARAGRDVERAVVRAPFHAWVRSEQVAPGQWIALGAELAVLAHAGRAEVRLPVPHRELEWIGGTPGASGSPAKVQLAARFAGQELAWPARLDRIEPELDPASRMAWLVAAVDDPYGLAREGDGGQAHAPLPSGLFVEAAVEGPPLLGVFLLPRLAERTPGELWLVDPEGHLERRAVDVALREGDEIVVRAGLEAGERIVVSPLATPVSGMAVTVLEDGGAR